MVLHRKQFNNGYGCSCCREDWEETDWVKDEEVPSIEEFFSQKLSDCIKAFNTGGMVGATYEKDGKILFGVEMDINRVNFSFRAVKGDVDDPEELTLEELEEPGNVPFDSPSRFDLEAVYAFYKKECQSED